jgi:hypothetical protein
MINAEFNPVSNMIGQRKVHTITQNSRLAIVAVAPLSPAGFCGPSLNQWRREKLIAPKHAPNSRKNQM